MRFEYSPVSNWIWEYAGRRLGQVLAPIVLWKVLTIHGSLADFPRLSGIHEGRSREFKTVTSKMAMSMFSKDMYVYIDGEKTIHRIRRDYGENLSGKCFIINDGTMIFNALGSRTKSRWLGAFAGLLTEENYEYGDNINRFTLKGRISLLINMPTPIWNYNKNRIFNSTLGNRLDVIHLWLRKKQNLIFKHNYEKTMKLQPKVHITRHNRKVIKNFKEYRKELEDMALDYSCLAVRSQAEMLDVVSAIVREHARINNRSYICDEDIRLLRILRDYHIDPNTPDEHRVVSCLDNCYSFKEICHLLRKPTSYKSTISYYRKKALERGVLDPKNQVTTDWG